MSTVTKAMNCSYLAKNICKGAFVAWDYPPRQLTVQQFARKNCWVHIF